MPEVETKHMLALIVLIGFGSAATFALMVSQRLREFALFAFVVGSVLVDGTSATFLGQYWYRGTSRGVEISAVDMIPLCLIAGNFLLPAGYRSRFFWPAGLGLLLAYAAYCIGSVMTSDPRLYGLWELAKIGRGIVVLIAAALFVRSRRALAAVVAGMAVAVCLQCGVAVYQRFGVGVFRSSGTMDHENTLSTYLCLVGPVLVAASLARWSNWLRGAAAVGWVLAAIAEVLTLSRAGVPVFTGMSVATLVCCFRLRVRLTRRESILAAIAACIIGVFVYASWDSLGSRYRHLDFKREFAGTAGFESRGIYWRMAFAMATDHPFGVGLNNWSYFVGQKYGAVVGHPYATYGDSDWMPIADDPRQAMLPPAADTLPALTLGELGVVGLLLFTLVWLRWLQVGSTFLADRRNPDPMHRLGIGLLFGTAGVFLQSATEWTYRQTPVLFTCHFCVGTLASLYFSRRVAAAANEPALAPAADPVRRSALPA